MSQVILLSPGNSSIKPIVESALQGKARILEISIKRTQARIRRFEETYGLITPQFLEKFRQNELQHSFDFDDWIGEARMLTRLQEKLDKIKGIEIVD